MNYDVIWVPSAENQLASIWTAARNRTAVARAAARIDGMLANDPNSEGESRPDGRRVLIVMPLVVYYQVDEADRRVRVLHVRASRTFR
jgi:plasmid stabilization system protein ParE